MTRCAGSESTSASGSEFLAGLDTAFERACSPTHPLRERRLRIGGLPVTLQFAGAGLVERFTRAFAHLPTHDSPTPDLGVRIWDVAGTGSRPPTPPWGLDRYVARGEIEHLLGEGFLATFSIESGIFLCLDLATSRGYAWVRDVAELWPWDVAAPLRSLFGWWVRARGGQLVHGAAVGSEHGAVLLAAPGGSGKSSTALACARRGMSYFGDDYVLLRRHDEGLRLWSLYQSAKVGHDHLAAAFPDLTPSPPLTRTRGAAPDDAGFDKAVLYLDQVFPDRLAESQPLRAVVIPRLASGEVFRIRPARQADVLTALAPTTLFQLPGAGADAFGFMAEVARAVPGYVMDLGGNPDPAVAALRRLTAGEEVGG